MRCWFRTFIWFLFLTSGAQKVECDICSVVDCQVQLLSDNQRGATLEAVVSRMKTIHSLNAAELKTTAADCTGIRFITVSATIPNVSDVRRLHALRLDLSAA